MISEGRGNAFAQESRSALEHYGVMALNNLNLRANASPLRVVKEIDKPNSVPFRVAIISLGR